MGKAIEEAQAKRVIHEHVNDAIQLSLWLEYDFYAALLHIGRYVATNRHETD